VDTGALVGVAGVAGTLLSGLGGAYYADHRADARQLRRERLDLYVDALNHAAALRRRFLAGSAPVGGPASLAPGDEVTAKMDLFAHRDVRAAWAGVIRAVSNFEAWIEYDYSGEPDYEPPLEVTSPLDAALLGLTNSCRGAMTGRTARN